MFPGRVGRMILDGVADTDDYFGEEGWLGNTVDMDELFDKFWDGCLQAGPEECSLAKLDNPKQLFWSWVRSYDKDPRTVVTKHGRTIILTGDDIKKWVGGCMYAGSEMSTFCSTFIYQALLEEKSAIGTLALHTSSPAVYDMCSHPVFDTPSNNSIPHFKGRGQRQPEMTSAVLCSDSPDLRNKSLSWWHTYVQKQNQVSRLFGRYWASHRLRCASWPFKSNWRFTGPFTTPPSDPELKPGIPAAPILFLSSRLDPVTPVRAARKMASRHPGAQLVIQESLGHGAMAAEYSPCVQRIVADYMGTGKLPSEETSCPHSCGYWHSNCTYEGPDFSSVRNWFMEQRRARTSFNDFILG